MLYIIREFIKVQPPGGRLYVDDAMVGMGWGLSRGWLAASRGTASAGQVTISRGPWPVWR